MRIGSISIFITLLTLASANHLTDYKNKWVPSNQGKKKSENAVEKSCVEKGDDKSLEYLRICLDGQHVVCEKAKSGYWGVPTGEE
jgi:single-stranded DNA-specific DHH superfamily exonuclease